MSTTFSLISRYRAPPNKRLRISIVSIGFDSKGHVVIQAVATEEVQQQTVPQEVVVSDPTKILSLAETLKLKCEHKGVTKS